MSTSWQWVQANPDAAARQIRDLERENESLLEQVRGLEPMIDRLERENAALRESRERLVRTASEVLEAFVLHKQVETGHPCPENMCICIDLRAAIDAARKEAQP